MPKNFKLRPFPDPVSHFGAPWRTFWIFEVLKEGMIESKKLFGKSCSGSPIIQGFTYFQTPSAILGPPGSHFGFLRFSKKECLNQKTDFVKVVWGYNNLWYDLLPDPIGHFGAPWQPFWIFEVLKEGMIESKNLFSES